MIEEKFKEAINQMFRLSPPDEATLKVLRATFFAGWGECIQVIEQELPKVNVTEAVMISNAMKVELKKFWTDLHKPKIIVEP